MLTNIYQKEQTINPKIRKEFTEKPNCLSPVSIVDLEDNANLDPGEESSTYLQLLLDSATEVIQEVTNRVFLQHTVNQYIDFEGSSFCNYFFGSTIYQHLSRNNGTPRRYELSPSPVIAVTSISIFDRNNQETALDLNDFLIDVVDKDRTPRVALNFDAQFPVEYREILSLKTTFTCGYGTTPKEIPAAIRLAIIQLATYNYYHRGDCGCGSANMKQLLPGTHAMISPYIMYRI